MLLDLLFPKICLGCGKLGTYICSGCEAQLEYVEKDACLYCKKISHLGFTHPGCKRIDGIDAYLSVLYYNPVLKKIIKNIKYRRVRQALPELFNALAAQNLYKLKALQKMKTGVVLQPIPLHKHRFNERGFNQAQLLSEFFCKLLQLSVEDLLFRQKDTPHQAQQHERKDRYLNMLGAFGLKDMKTIPERVILVDDVVTTGSTVKEAAKTLKKAGVKEVFVFSLARG